MPYAQTMTDLANKALSSIGLDLITSIEGTDDKSQVCKLWTPEAIVYCLDKFNWQELYTTVTLEQNPTDTPEGAARWNLPANFLHMVRVVSTWPTEWHLDGDKLVTSVSTTEPPAPQIVYIPVITNPGGFGYNLYRCIYTRLAAMIALPLTHDDLTISKATQDAARAWAVETGRAVIKRQSGLQNARGKTWNNSRYGVNWPGHDKEIVSG